MKPLFTALRGFGPAVPRASTNELARNGLGALIGIGACTLLALLWPSDWRLPLMLVAPLGASAVLIFAAPNAPLAQPWSAVVGNIVSALVAVAVLKLLPGPWAPAMAVGLAIMAMLLTQALHPPGGAVALLATLDPGPVLSTGFAFALIPVGLMTLTLVLVGVGFNRLIGRSYPLRQQAVAQPPAPAQAAEQSLETRRREEARRLGLSDTDAASLLTRPGHVPDTGRSTTAPEAVAPIRQPEHSDAHRRTVGDGTAIRGSLSIADHSPLSEAHDLIRRHNLHSLPVVDRDGRFVGLIHRSDLADVFAEVVPMPFPEEQRLSAAQAAGSAG